MTSLEPTNLYIDAMATRFEVALHGAERSRLRAAGEEAMREISSLERQLSMFRSDSDVAQINRLAAQKPVKVETRLFRLLQLCRQIYDVTAGAFDITVAPVMEAWRLAGVECRLPSDDELAEARQRVGMRYVILDEENFTVYFSRDGIKIDLGAIGKGYAIDRAVESLIESGIDSALIHGGTSTIYAIGTQPDGEPWRIGISDPVTHEAMRTIDLRDSSLSVSAPHGRLFINNDRRYGHVLDPRTGEPTQTAALASVWGPQGTLTDALSTALLVLGDDGARVIKQNYPEYETAIKH
ncbi:MAG: FAD:protein FMN transferase [Armatimonadetes bacterium]|nr:FAD:protein FMN transferase [Armatimonadota bacterium]